MRRGYVVFRGEERAVDYRVDDDPSTNSCEAEWHFTEPEMQGIEPTETEDETITKELIERAFDADRYESPFLV